MGLLQSIRKWIDGETGEDLLEAADEHAKPRRVWEEFLVKIAREVEAAMQREMFTPPAESPLSCTDRNGAVRNDQVKVRTRGAPGIRIVAVPRAVSCGTVSMARQLMPLDVVLRLPAKPRVSWSVPGHGLPFCSSTLASGTVAVLLALQARTAHSNGRARTAAIDREIIYQCSVPEAKPTRASAKAD